MKILLLGWMLTAVFCYNDIRDEFNYDVYSKDIPLLQRHLDCYIDKGVCDPVPQSVKPHLAEVVADACQNCNDIQKHHGQQFVKAAKDFLPEGYQQFRDKYDPDGKHFDDFEAEIEKY